MVDDPAISVRGLSKRFGNTWALRSVSFDLACGHRLALFGGNGAGKTTLLRILATAIRSYQGEARLFGEDLKKAGEVSRSRIGFLSHETFLYQDLTPRENLFFYARLYGLRKVGDRVERLLEQVGLEGKRNAIVRHLSRGLKQRLAIARVLIHEPRILLLDEPYTGLDESAAETLGGILSSFVAGGGTVVMASHDLQRGLDAASRVMVLDRGEVVFDEPAEYVDLDAFRRRYREILGN